MYLQCGCKSREGEYLGSLEAARLRQFVVVVVVVVVCDSENKASSKVGQGKRKVFFPAPVFVIKKMDSRDWGIDSVKFQ